MMSEADRPDRLTNVPPDETNIVQPDETNVVHPDEITIVHLAVDYNTPRRPKTTNAVEWFVNELSAFDNVVIAMLRSSRPAIARLGMAAAVECEARKGRLFDYPYFGLPLGIGLHRSMRAAARGIIALLEREGIRPSLIHAHKFTFEGLAGWYVARHFEVPLFISLRGEVETKVFRAKPLLRPFLRRVAQDADRLYFVSAWFEPTFHAYVPGVAAKERRLPTSSATSHRGSPFAPPTRGWSQFFISTRGSARAWPTCWMRW